MCNDCTACADYNNCANAVKDDGRAVVVTPEFLDSLGCCDVCGYEADCPECIGEANLDDLGDWSDCDD